MAIILNLIVSPSVQLFYTGVGNHQDDCYSLLIDWITDPDGTTVVLARSDLVVFKIVQIIALILD